MVANNLVVAIPKSSKLRTVWYRPVVYFLLLGLLSACGAEEIQEGPANGSTRSYSGVWLYQFEGSTFLEGATEVPKSEIAPQDAAWLEYHPEEVDPNYLHPKIEDPSRDYDRYDVERECYPKFAFAISFEGMQTTYPKSLHNLPGGGHLGLWGSDISVKRLISIKPLSGNFC